VSEACLEYLGWGSPKVDFLDAEIFGRVIPETSWLVDVFVVAPSLPTIPPVAPSPVAPGSTPELAVSFAMTDILRI